MRVRTLFLYLIGNRRAILEIAANRRSLWIGLLFVFSAAFAREYDGQDLLAEPWHLFIPVVASFGAASLLFLVVCGGLFFYDEGRPPFFAAFRSFLALFWMTAPLAWLYAVPYERFLSAGDATAANLLSLAFVAAWRVALMVRVTSVLTARGIVSSMFLVMAFGDALALVAVFFIPQPIAAIMGGVHFTESESIIQGTTLVVACIGIVSAPIWGVGALIALFMRRPVWQLSLAPSDKTGISRGMWILAVSSLLIWLPILPWTQREQQLRFQVESTMSGGRIAEALDIMSAHTQSDFPPLWDPPPRFVRIGSATQRPSSEILDVMDQLQTRDYPEWVKDLYVRKFLRYIEYKLEEWKHFFSKPGDDLARIVHLLQRIPQRGAIIQEHVDDLKNWPSINERERSKEEQDNLKLLLDLLANPKPVPTQ